MSTEHDLAPYLPALLDALSSFNVAAQLICEEGGTYKRKYANRAAAAVYGVPLEEYMTLDPLADVVPEERPLMQSLADNFRAGQAIPATLEVTGLHRDGHRLTLEVSVGRVPMGDVQGFAIVMREVGAHPRVQLSLLEEDRISLVGALAAGFAHEINNPLTSVLLNLRSVRKLLGALPDAQQRQALRGLDDITTGAERIASNVRALQTLATRSSPQTVDLAAVVTSALRLVAPTIDPRAHIVRQIEPVCPVTGEESRIGQAVLAMMLFASSGFDETTGASNRIVVVVEERGGGVVVEVSDNGHALTDDEARGAFDPFFRSHSGARGAGIGVGLAVARSVATKLGGEVTLAPRLGGGAVITMRLPSAEAAVPVPDRVRIISEHRGAYRAASPTSPGVSAWVELTGKAYNAATDKRGLPTVGDYVTVDRWTEALAENGAAIVQEIEPRRSFLVRKAAGEATAPQPVAANVDTGFVLTSANADLSPARLDRYVTLLRDGNITPVLVLSKIDLVVDHIALLAEIATVSDVRVIAVSATTGVGLAELRALGGPGTTSVLLGSSGVGKSTLLNALIGTHQLTRDIRADERGRHTTTHRELFVADDGSAWIDTPGMRELAQFLDDDALDGASFDDIVQLATQCRFRDCTHNAEPGCAVRDAVPAPRLASFHKLSKERAAATLKQDKAYKIAQHKKAIRKLSRVPKKHDD